MTTHLDRLLFAQGGTCFFCRKPLPKAEASVEHLVASANGGTNGDDNCVACCKALNHLLGSKSIKGKLQIVLNQRGDFRCPGNVPAAQPSAQESASGQAKTLPADRAGKGNGAAAPPPASERINLVVSDLCKRGASRPRKVSTLTSTIKALIKQQQQVSLSDADAAALIQDLQRRGKLTVSDTKVSYTLG
jgi:hypothetical protein